MPWHILLECKAAQDHLEIMNHDNLGYDEVEMRVAESKSVIYINDPSPHQQH